MELVIYTNFLKGKTKSFHILEIPVEYFSYYEQSKELYVYQEETGFTKLDTTKIRQIGTQAKGMYCNSIFFNSSNNLEELAEDISQEELLKRIVAKGGNINE